VCCAHTYTHVYHLYTRCRSTYVCACACVCCAHTYTHVYHLYTRCRSTYVCACACVCCAHTYTHVYHLYTRCRSTYVSSIHLLPQVCKDAARWILLGILCTESDGQRSRSVHPRCLTRHSLEHTATHCNTLEHS